MVSVCDPKFVNALLLWYNKVVYYYTHFSLLSNLTWKNTSLELKRSNQLSNRINSKTITEWNCHTHLWK